MATMTMAALTGSERQVAWAEDIRAAMLPAFTPTLEAHLTANPRIPAARAERLRAAIETIRAQASASWWIDHRVDMQHRPASGVTLEQHEAWLSARLLQLLREVAA
jgi:hypothetical protein